MRILTVCVATFIFVGSAIVAQEGERRAVQVSEGNASQVSVDQVAKEKTQIETPEITEQRPMNFWMSKKLDYSKSILESLTKGDFERLAVDAERLRVLGKLEGFVRSKNASYRLQMSSFDVATRGLVNNAEKRNAEGASLAFNQLTNSCVNCHQLLRAGIK